jgi:hypothetical protein
MKKKMKQGRKVKATTEARRESKRPHQENYGDYSRHPMRPQGAPTSAHQIDPPDTLKQPGGASAKKRRSEGATQGTRPRASKMPPRNHLAREAAAEATTRNQPLEGPSVTLRYQPSTLMGTHRSGPFGHTSQAVRTDDFNLKDSPKPEA